MLHHARSVSRSFLASVSAAALSISLASAQLPCQAPTQLLQAQVPGAFEGFGQDGAVDGDTALVLSRETGSGGGGPLDVHVLARDAAGVWSITQVLRLSTSSLSAPNNHRVHLQGDVAAVTVTCSPFPIVEMLERDPVTGLWSERQTIPFPFLNCPSTFLHGERLAIGDSIAHEVRIYDRSPGGDWLETLTISGPTIAGLSSFGAYVALSSTTLVVVDEHQRDVFVYEEDASGGYTLDLLHHEPLSPTSLFGILGRSLELDEERLAVWSIDGPNTTGSTIELFRRTSTATPRWAYEGTLTSDPAGRTRQLGFDTKAANGTLVTTVVAANECGGALTTRVVLAREPGFLPVWTPIASICASQFGAVTSPHAIPLDYDGETLMLSLASEDVGGVQAAGRVALVPLPSVAVDCDGNCQDDASEIAACAGCDLNANGRLDRCERRGVRYCDPAVTNSTGAPGRIDLYGSTSAVGTDLIAVARSVPANSFGVLVSARSTAFVPGAGGSAGVLCVGGPAFGRFPASSTGSQGTFVAPIDPTNLPAGPAPYAVQPGDTVYFQAWFRDGASSNLTDAVALTFGG